MKRLLFSLLVLAVLAAPLSCQQGRDARLLRQAWEVMESRPDSALWLLDDVDTAALGADGRARYGLLLTQARHKLYKPVASDSLITAAIRHFRQSGDRYLLATSLYYKGVVVYNLGRRQEATRCLKEAEALARELDDELLRNKIYENLEMVNTYAGQLQEKLKYARLFLASSEALGDSLLIIRAYDHLHTSYIRLGQKDSAQIYYDRLLKSLEHANEEEKAYAYANIASYFLREQNFDAAKGWLQKAMAIKPRANQFYMLGKISLHEGDTTMARHYWQQTLSFGNHHFSIQAYQRLRDLCIDRHDFQQALLYTQLRDSIQTAERDRQQSEQVMAIQRRYDNAVLEKKVSDTKTLVLEVCLAAIVIISMMSWGFVRYRRQLLNRFDADIAKYMEQQKALRSQIATLKASGQDGSGELEMLNAQLQQLSEDMNVKLGRGRLVYETFSTRQSYPRLSNYDEQCFACYYCVTFFDRYMAAIQPYRQLVPRHITYLLMKDMGLDDKAVCQLLSVAPATVRTYRHRIKQLQRV